MNKNIYEQAEFLLNRLQKNSSNLLSKYSFDQQGNIIGTDIHKGIFIKLEKGASTLFCIEGVGNNGNEIVINHAACAIELHGTKIYRALMSIFIREVAKIKPKHMVIIDKQFLTNTSSLLKEKQLNSIKEFCLILSPDAKFQEIDHAKKITFTYKDITNKTIDTFIANCLDILIAKRLTLNA